MELKSVETIVRALNEAHVRFCIVGGLAVNAHGHVRLTVDLDIVFQLDPENASAGLNTLLSCGYNLSVPINPKDFSDAIVRQQWRQDKKMIVLKLWSDQHKRTPIDVFIYEPFDFNNEEIVQMEITPGLLVPFVSLETLLEMKREAGRPGDLQDIKELNRIRDAGI